MAINSDLMRAILALDAYNRGYNAGVILPGGDDQGTQIASATILGKKGDATAQASSFYGVAYTLAGGSNVISYRGTDQALPSWENWTLGDIVNGWVLGSGVIGAAQGRMAIA